MRLRDHYNYQKSQFQDAETIIEMCNAGCAAVHIEDQVFDKRCGHRPNKQLVSIDEMRSRLNTAINSKVDDSFFIMARTDAIASEGIDLSLIHI